MNANHIASDQRWTKSHRCPICGHYQNDPNGHCDGYESDGGAICTRAEFANGAVLNEKCVPHGYFHKREEDGTYRPWTATPPIPFRATRRATAPENAEPQPKKTHQAELGTRYFRYTDTQRIRRITSAHQPKDVKPQHYANGQWYIGDGPGPIEYIYRRAEIAARLDEALDIFEGEPCADAGAALGLRAMTWRGGTGRVSQATEQIKEVAAGQHVRLHEDSDGPGRKAMQKIAAEISSVVASVKIVDYFPDENPERGGRDIQDWLTEGGTTDDLVRLIADAHDYEPDDSKPLPAIDVGNHNMTEVSAQMWDAVIAKNDPAFLFEHAGILVRLQYGEEGRIVLVPLTEHRLRCEVAEAADCYIVKGKEQQVIAAEPPLSMIQNMLAQAKLPLPTLRQITETPVFAPDGRLIEAAGFDTASGIYYRPVAGLTVPPVPDEPTADDVAKARNLIVDDLLGDFPFTEQADRAAAVALFVLPYVRAMIPGLTPMHGIESPTVGSGKGLLGDVLVRPAFGQHGGMIAEARDDDEWRKRIGAKLREGSPIIHIDNVTRPLDSGALAMALTAPVFSDRILGQTATFRATVHNVWMFTANNPVMSLEIARRTVRIRIDTNEEKPWQRDTFKHKNLRAWADTHRGDLIHAALTLVRAWVVAGKPIADVTLGSYEEWAATMGGILDVASVMGFLDNLSAFYEAADVEGAAWRQFVALWAGAHASNKVGVGDLFTLALGVEGLDFGQGGERSQRVSFGSQLTKQRDRIYDGYRITLAGTSKNAKQWRLLPIKPGGGESRQQRFTPDSADIATESDERVNLGESFSTPRARKNVEEFPIDRESEKIHRDSPDPSFSFRSQGKPRVNLRGGDSPEGERPLAEDDLPDRVALRQWAADEALGWENRTFPEAAIREATRRYYALTIPPVVPRDELAKVILAAMKGGR